MYKCRHRIVAIKFSNELFLLFVISDERDAIQKKTFTKWVNKHLKKVSDSYSIRRKVFPFLFSFNAHTRLIHAQTSETNVSRIDPLFFVSDPR